MKEWAFPVQLFFFFLHVSLSSSSHFTEVSSPHYNQLGLKCTIIY